MKIRRVAWYSIAPPHGIGSVGGNCQVAVVVAVEELRTLVIVEQRKADVLVGV